MLPAILPASSHNLRSSADKYCLLAAGSQGGYAELCSYLFKKPRRSFLRPGRSAGYGGV
jgi:hypothetical protein